VIGKETDILVDGEPTEIVKRSEWLVLLKVPALLKPPIPLRSERLEVGDPTFGFGWAWGKLFLSLNRTVAGYDQGDLVVNGPFIEGMSGGPVTDIQGNVVGVIQGGVPAASFMSGIEEIRDFLKR
jgi:hypothetical protein